ncbi:MAG: beta-mannosidase [Bacteroidetes bacterium HGW-Bacteroidetes-1]|jgi:beta-mannosidase|nr:MAG: beta-mannosidase [Bacteroidetes bacterium HGW-Bacteroidetes-1]
MTGQTIDKAHSIMELLFSKGRDMLMLLKKAAISNVTFLSLLKAAILVVMLFSCASEKKPLFQSLNDGWMLYGDPLLKPIPAKVPGLVHKDLLDADFIEDFYFGENESSLQWIGEKEWEYTLTFSPDPELFRKESIELVFEGLDTYAHVFLNGKLLLKADNMFRSYIKEVKEQLKTGGNEIKIRFFPADSVNQYLAKLKNLKLPEERAYTRKAPYQFGWDWAPRYVTMGIWKSIQLRAWSKARIEYPTIHQMEVDSSKALLELDLEIYSSSTRSYKLELNHSGFIIIDNYVALKPGLNRIKIPFQMNNPELWWPNEMGKQHLYAFDLRLFDGSVLLDEKKMQTGLRSVKLVTDKDETGTSFYFKVNGIPVFMKGVNYVPEDNFPVKIPVDKTRKLLIDAAKVHMNMIRVWGGGIYPDDTFYKLCDSLGLLVWQDFMFAGSMYPFDDDFKKNVKLEATEQIKLLRNHPSLALWCGNNEISEGFHNWGWQKSLNWSKSEEQALWEGYLELFEEVLPELVQQYDSIRSYWPSSPSKGWGRPESLTQGDVHYWGVWWGEEPFGMYEKKVGRFNSEYGFQAMPSMATIKQFSKSDDWYVGSAVLEAHQKHPRGTQLIRKYMERDFPVPEKLDEYVYVSQLLQSFGVCKAIEAHHRNQPVTMGTLYWQLNDSWPATSWSSIDYFGRWKALHYHLKEVYAPLTMSVHRQNNTIHLYVVNDNKAPISARLEIDLKSMDGSVLHSYTEPVLIGATESLAVKVISLKELLSNIDPATVFLHCRIMLRDQQMAQKIYYFVSPKNLQLLKEGVRMHILPKNNRVELVLNSHVLIKNLMVTSNDEDGVFEDNFFDLIPGEQRVINFYPSKELEMKNIKFELMMLNNLKE